MEDNIVILNDENGAKVRFEFLDLIEYEGEEYVVLLPVEDNDGMVVILKLEESAEDEELESYVSVDDEDVIQEVFRIFKARFEDEFDFLDESGDNL